MIAEKSPMSESEKNDFPVMPPPPQREARTVREYFDQIPEESEKTLPDKKHAAQEEEQDALRSYFREMGEMPQLSPQEEFDLWEQIDGNVCQLRHCIYQFAFVYDEHVKLLANPEEDLADIFPPSSRDNVPLPDDPGRRQQWASRISAVVAEMRAVFPGMPKAEFSRLREKGFEILNTHPAVLEKLLEWSDVANRYLENYNAGRLTSSEIERIMLMNVDEIIRLSRKMGELRREIDRWKVRMLETNLRLVINIAKHYQHKGLPFGDLIQEGNLGLMKALEKFDYKLGHRFCTYASWWVRQAVARALSAQSRVIRLPIHMLATIRKMNIAEKNFIQLNGNEPTIEELAQIMEMPKERISAIKKMSLQCISLQAPQSSDDPDFTIENFLSDKESDDPMKSLARKMMKERLAEAINQLSEREKQVITMRYGLDGGPCKTLTEVSAIFNVTRERVRQLELKTLEKLRKHSDSGKYLEDFFL